MTDATDPNDAAAVTLVHGAIHNPGEPRHFMQLEPSERRWVATIDNQPIADSTSATVVKEVGRNVYDPIVYFPRHDVADGVLAQIDKTTHCPLKGDTDYFDVVAGDVRHGEAAWSYHNFTVTDDLVGLVAFDPARVEVRAIR